MSKEKDDLLKVLTDFAKDYVLLELSGVKRDNTVAFLRDHIHPYHVQQLYVMLDAFRMSDEIEDGACNG
jgi:hypothetical protein